MQHIPSNSLRLSLFLAGRLRKDTNQKITEVIKYNEKIHWNNFVAHNVVGMFTNCKNIIAC